MRRDFIVPGHPVGDIIPDVGAEIGPFCYYASAQYSKLGDERFQMGCEYFMLACEHAGVRISPLRARIKQENTERGHIWKACRSFRVEAIDPSRFLRNYQKDRMAADSAELNALKA